MLLSYEPQIHVIWHGAGFCPARGWARLRLLAGQVMGMFTHRSRTESDREGHRSKARREPTLGLSTSPGLRAQAWRPSPPSAPATPPAWQRKSPGKWRGLQGFWRLPALAFRCEQGEHGARDGCRFQRCLQFSSNINSYCLRSCVLWLKARAMEPDGLHLDPSSAWVM